MLCLRVRFWLALTACAAQADEVVITLGGDCVLGTREEWKNDPETFDTMIAEKGFEWCFCKDFGAVCQ